MRTKRQYPTQRPKAVDLFCGAGGMSLGFEQAGFDIILGIDADGHHVAAHERNFPYGKAVCTSVVGLSASDIKRLAGEDGEVDLLFGGPPCQGFSNMGHRDTADPRNTLVDEFIRIALELRPKFVVMENVPGILAGDTRPILDRAVRTLSRAYNVTTPIRVLNASDFGVPQDRRRVFVLAVRKDVAESVSYPDCSPPGQPARPTVQEAISDLPEVEKSEELFTGDTVPYDRAPKSPYAQVARGILADPSDLSIPRNWNTGECSGCMRTRHLDSSIALYRATPPGMMVPGHKLPRLSPNRISPTLRAGSDSSRGSYTSPRPIHPFLPRCITAREAARLHGYPDWFRFIPTKWHAYKQIGNSVCPPVARAVGHQLLDILNPPRRSRVPKSLTVTNEFRLPEDRPRQKPRIPQMREFPPVMRALFASAFDSRTGRLRKARFSFSDIQRIVKETGVHLPWIRPDTFLQEIARSRNVVKILSEPLKHGFSIRPVSDNGFIGEFVTAESEGAIHEKDEAGPKAGDLANSLQVQLPMSCLAKASTTVRFLDQQFVRTSIWGSRVRSIDPGQIVDDERELSVNVTTQSGKRRMSLVILAKDGNVPPRSRISRIADASGVDEVVTVTRVTSHHVVTIRYNKCRTQPREASRVVFVLNGQTVTS